MQINRDRALAFLEEAIRYPHPQNEMDRVRGYIADVVMPVVHGLAFDSIRLDDRGNLIAQKGVDGLQPPLVLCTYAGIYSAAGMPDANSPTILAGEPYGLEGECMWGRGTTEQVSAGAALMEAMCTLTETQSSLQRGVVWLTTTSGEMGNHEAVSYIFDQLKTPMGPALTALASDNHVCLGNLGRVDVVLWVKGKACHSSDPTLGNNVITGLQHILNKVYSYRPLPSDPDLGAATLTPTSIRTWPEVAHTVPDFLELVLDRRLIPGEDPNKCLDQIVASLGELPQDLTLDYEREPNIQYPYKANSDSQLVQSLKGAVVQVLGESRTIYQRSALDMGFFGIRGYDAVTFGPGDPSLAHSNHEMVNIQDYLDAARVYLVFLEKFLL